LSKLLWRDELLSNVLSFFLRYERVIDLLCAADAADGDAGDGVSGVGGVGGVGGGGGDVTTEMIEMKAERTSGEGGGEGDGGGGNRRRPLYNTGRVGEAVMHVMDAEAMWRVALAALEVDPMCLVDKIKPGSESHFLRPSSESGEGGCGVFRYEVRPAQ
jgi:hypothetical protein